MERTCELCEYEHESLNGEHCLHCLQNATDNFKQKMNVCEWKEETEEGYYETSCKRLVTIISGTANDNGYKYCPYCGKEIRIVGD